MCTSQRSMLMALLAFLLPCASAWGQREGQRGSQFSQWDLNGDGHLSRKEFPSRFNKRLFDQIDDNGDGKISRAEDDAYRARRAKRNQRDGGRGGDAVDVKVLRDVVYETVGKRKLPLDLYLPRSEKPMPLVIWIHGGGWQGGTKKSAGAAGAMVGRGYAVASVEYRLSGEAIFPAAIEDCKAAVSYLRLNAKKYNLDPDKFGVWGSSAGGHLVALLGTTNDVKDFDTHPVTKEASSAVQAVCDWFGPTDFLRMNDFKGRIDHDGADSPESRFIGGPIQENKAKVQRANPITYISDSDPPFLITHGAVDQAVPYNQSVLLHTALKKAGVQSTLDRVAKGDHGFRGADISREELTKRGMDFFDSVFR